MKYIDFLDWPEYGRTDELPRPSTPRPLSTLSWEPTSVSNASDTGPSGAPGAERLHFLLAIGCSRAPRVVRDPSANAGFETEAIIKRLVRALDDFIWLKMAMARTVSDESLTC